MSERYTEAYCPKCGEVFEAQINDQQYNGVDRYLIQNATVPPSPTAPPLRERADHQFPERPPMIDEKKAVIPEADLACADVTIKGYLRCTTHAVYWAKTEIEKCPMCACERLVELVEALSGVEPKPQGRHNSDIHDA